MRIEYNMQARVQRQSMADLFKTNRVSLPRDPPEALRARRVPPLVDITVQIPSGDTFLVTPQELFAQLKLWGFTEEQAWRFVDYVGCFLAAHLDLASRRFVWVPPDSVPSGLALPVA